MSSSSRSQKKSVAPSVRAKSSVRRPLKVALVCDWLTNVGGAERVLKSFSDLFPSAPIYTSQYNQKKIDWFKDKDVRVGWLQIFPSSLRRFLGPLRQFYFNHLNLSDYDLIISVTGAEAKSVKFNQDTSLHLCYCHVPTQYYWGLKDDYEKNPGFGLLNPLVRLALKILLPPLKSADFAAAQRPSNFITISTYAAEQIKKSYGRDAEIIFPPVAVKQLILTKTPTAPVTSPEKSLSRKKSVGTSARAEHSRSGFVVTSRQVSWKRLDLAVKACLKLKLPLTVIGEGPEHSRLKKLVKKSKTPAARELITFLPQMPRSELKRYLESAEGYIFPSLEPFGIAPLEALACGCPLIAYGRGGALDYCIDGENGVLFGKQSVSSLCQALKRFKTLKFSEPLIRTSALPFDEKVFQQKIKSFVSTQLALKQGIKPPEPTTIPAPVLKPRPKKPAPEPASKPTSKPAPKPTPKQKPAPVKPKNPKISPQPAQKVKPPHPAPSPQKPQKVKQGNKKTQQQTIKNVKQIQINKNEENPREKAPHQPGLKIQISDTPKPKPPSSDSGQPKKITIN